MTVLRGMSFHSVKGGVGKSTLATATAVQHAIKHKEDSVVLLDMDLTGTSLADVLSLCAPKWKEDPAVTRELLETQTPDTFYGRKETLERIQDRSQFERNEAAQRDYQVPFLNDFLLHTPTDRGNPRDICVDSLLWQMSAEHSNLRVIPSSAIPGDLELIMPVIFDEQHAGFLEARLEVLLDRLLTWHQTTKRDGDVVVVVDVPPTIPGLSRSVMSLGLRLVPPKKLELSDDGGMPTGLKNSSVTWRISLVTTMDRQDLRAVLRWIRLVGPDEGHLFKVVVNRVSGEDPNIEATFKKWLEEHSGVQGIVDSPLLLRPDFVPTSSRGFFEHDDDAKQTTAIAEFKCGTERP